VGRRVRAWECNHHLQGNIITTLASSFTVAVEDITLLWRSHGETKVHSGETPRIGAFLRCLCGAAAAVALVRVHSAGIVSHLAPNATAGGELDHTPGSQDGYESYCVAVDAPPASP